MILVNGLTARGVCMDFLSLNLQSLKLSLIAKHGSVCAQCGAKGPVDLDHIEPRSKGRDDRPENLQLLGINCGCHAKKHGVPQWSKNG